MSCEILEDARKKKEKKKRKKKKEEEEERKAKKKKKREIARALAGLPGALGTTVISRAAPPGPRAWNGIGRRHGRVGGGGCVISVREPMSQWKRPYSFVFFCCCFFLLSCTGGERGKEGTGLGGR